MLGISYVAFHGQSWDKHAYNDPILLLVQLGWVNMDPPLQTRAAHRLGLDKLCRHNFERNRCLKASGVMPSLIGEFSSINNLWRMRNGRGRPMSISKRI